MSDTNDELYGRIRALRGATKHCSTCAQEHPIQEFAIKSRDKLTVQTRCKNSCRAVGKTWYAANSERHRATSAENRKARYEIVCEIVDAWLDGKRCESCDATSNLVAVGPDGSLRRGLATGWSPDLIAEYLPLAAVRCVTCRQSAALPVRSGG